MLYILLIFTCISDGNLDSCPVEPTVHMDISLQQCIIERDKLQPTLQDDQTAVCVELDLE